MKNSSVILRCVVGYFFLLSALGAQVSDCAAVVNHAPNINQGIVEGSIQQQLPRSINLNSGAVITGDLLVPGTPSVRVNGAGEGFGGIVESDGAIEPQNYHIHVNRPVQLRSIIRRTGPIGMPTAQAVEPVQGRQWINLNRPGEEPDSFSDVRGINVNAGYGDLILPTGSYQNVNVSGGHDLVLGREGDLEPAVYSIQNLALNSESDLIVRGPVELRLGNSFNIHGVIGSVTHPEWLSVHLVRGGMNLNAGSQFSGTLIAPQGDVHINRDSILRGRVFVNRLTVNAGGKLICAVGEPANQPPVAESMSLETPEDVALSVNLEAFDPEGQALSYIVLSAPQFGTLSGEVPNMIYTPNANYHGADQFTFQVNDGELDSEIATVDIRVLPVNDAPLAKNLSLETNEDEAVGFELLGADTDGDPLSYQVITAPLNGVITGSGSSLVYTPNSDFYGVDSVSYVVNDGFVDSEEAVVQITVLAVNDAPVAEDVEVVIDSGDSVALILRGTDKETPVADLRYELLSDPASVSVIGEAPELSLQRLSPTANTEVVFYRVFDGEDFSEPASITIRVVEQSYLSVDAGRDKNLVFEEVYQGGDFALPSGGVSRTLGRDFWLCFPSSYVGQNEEHKILISSDQNTTVTVSTRDEVLETVEVQAGEIREVIVPAELELAAVDSGIEDKGIRVESEHDVSVYAVNLIQFASEGYLALPNDIAGREYYVVTYSNTSGRPSSFAVVAIEDDTTVSITPSARVRLVDGRIIDVGETYEVTLQKGQVYQAQSSVDLSSDLTGTFVSSDKAVHVFGAHNCANVPTFLAACDHLVEQMPPLAHWGKEFLTSPFATRSADIFRILSSQDNNRIYVNGRLRTVLEKGQLSEFTLSESVQVVTSEPVLVVQYSRGQNSDGVMADPSMMIVPSIEQYANQYIVQNEEFNFTTNFINVTGSQRALEVLYLDGELLDQSLVQEVGTSGFFHAQIPVNPGSHRVESEFPFGCFVYGFGNFDAYSYPAGLVVPRPDDGTSEAEVRFVSVAMNAEEFTQFESAALEITITDVDGEPIANAEAQVAISGAQELTRSVVSDTEGRAYYSFQGLSQGVTEIVVTSGAASTETSIEWLPRWFELQGQVGASADTVIQWSVLGDDIGVVIEDSNSLQTRFSIQEPGTYTFELTGVSQSLSESDQVRYVIGAEPEIIVDAGLGRRVTLGDEVNLVGQVIANQDLPEDLVSPQWRLQTGDSSAVTIENPQSLSTGIIFREPGDYVFEFSSALSRETDTVEVTVLDPDLFYTEPQAFDRSYSVRSGNSISIPLVFSVDESYEDSLEIVITQQPRAGVLTGTPPFMTYTAGRFLDKDSFRFQVYDGRSYSREATIDIGVDRGLVVPFFENQPEREFLVAEHSLTHNTSAQYSFQFLARDQFGEVLTFSLENAPEGAQIDESTGLFQWDTTEFAEGTYTYTVRADDPGGLFAVQDVELDLRRDQSPIITQTSFSTRKDEAFTVSDLVEDDHQENLTYTLNSTTNHGLLEWLENGFRYTPASGFVGTDTFTLTVSDGINIPVTQPLSIHVLGETNQPPQIHFPESSVRIDLGVQGAITQLPTVSDDTLSPAELSYQWAVVSDGEGVVFSDSEAIQTDFTVPLLGGYTLELTVSDGLLSSSAQYHLEIVASGNTAPQVTLEPLYLLNLSESNTLRIEPVITDDGRPIGTALGTEWEQVSGPEALIASPESEVLDVRFARVGEYQFTCSVNDGQFVTSGTTNVVVTREASVAPRVFAGPDQILSTLGTVELSGTAADDGFPSPLQTEWVLLSGPADVEIESVDSLQTSVELTEYGVYRFALSANDGEFIVSDELIVNVRDTSVPPTLSAGDDFTYQIGSGEPLILNGSSTGRVSSTEWIMLEGYVGTQIVDASSLVTEVLPSVAGIYVFGVQAPNNPFVTSDTVTVTVTSAPTVSVRAPRNNTTLLENSGFTLLITASDLGGNIESLEVYEGTQLLGEATFVGNTTYLYSLDAGLPAGEYSFSAVATNSLGVSTTSDSVRIVSFENGDPPLPLLVSDFVVPEVVSAPTDIIGDAYGSAFVRYALSYRLFGEDLPWVEIGSGDAQVFESALAQFDPTLLENGLYEMQLEAFAEGGFLEVTNETFVIDSNIKLGQFTLAFEDLSVPVTGIPITVTRTYDSRDTQPGDFGIGWNLSYDDIKLRKTRDFGDDWSQSISLSTGILPVFRSCINPVGNRQVVLTFGDGRTEIFEVSAIAHGGPRGILGREAPANCVFFSAVSGAQLAFTPVASRNGKETRGSLELVNNDIFPVFPAEGIFDFPFFSEPRLFRYTDESGVVYLIDSEEGLQSITDTNGNTIDINEDGIIHSAGEDVQFVRNEKGFITEIIDPMGKRLSYTYDAEDRLVSFTNRVGDTTTFFYENETFTHYLTCIKDPRGVAAIRTEYDDEGRMVRQIDADGNDLNLEYAMADNIQVMVNRLGHRTVYQYDDNGNVAMMEDALGGVTRYTHDENDNETSTITPLGFETRREFDRVNNQLSETDPLGNITSYSYIVPPARSTAPRSNPLTITDALGHTTNFAYDGRGVNLTVMTDAVDASTSFSYDGRGNLSTLVDAVGTVTAYRHDSRGRELEMIVTDADGQLMRGESYSYDENGNRITSTTTRTLADGTQQSLTTSFLYDAENRVIQTTFPDGSTTSTVYNSIGKTASSTDQLGRVTTINYDSRGNQVLMTYPDSSTSSMTYDVENRQTSTTNQLGETTYMLYDALDRQTVTIYPDDTMPAVTLVEVVDIAAATELADNPRSITEYDADSRVIATIDALGNRTEFEYDAAGRRTLVRDALGQETLTEYDAAGRQIATVDARGNRSEFEYDDANRLVRTIFADATSTTVDYDALGRRTSVTDQEGYTTRFEYDALGRMIAVIDALDQRTEYEYDEQGSRLIQRDALGRETAYSYDTLGRRTARTLPEGQSESIRYDAIGNMTSRTDFNGHTTTYLYDIMNRVTSMNADTNHPSLTLAHAPSTFRYTYDLLGRRTSAESLNHAASSLYTDNWQYDPRGRLIEHGGTHGSLSYSYDANNNLLTAQSDITSGYKQGYQYDVLNRLTGLLEEHPTDPTAWQNLSSYRYDPNGNLAGVSYQNGIQHNYDYSVLNRLQTLNLSHQTSSSTTTPRQGYTYTLNRAGHRTRIEERSGRTVINRFDALYRLTSEQITEPVSLSPITSSYIYDAVGNRRNRTSTHSSIATIDYTYSANDWLSSDSYDANGNTTESADPRQFSGQTTANVTDIYDFRNKLIRRLRNDQTEIDLSYDIDGNRVRKTVYGALGQVEKDSLYLVDRNNHTGYAQVVEEMNEEGVLVSRYHYGHDLVAADKAGLTSVTDPVLNPRAEYRRYYYHYDGLGSVRAISEENGDTTEKYDYDAYGILIDIRKRDSTSGQLTSLPIENFAQESSNRYLFTGEQFDTDLGMYYLRARYLNTQTGRFHNMDTYEGRTGEPQTLHKYLYAHSNPVSNIDPSGNVSLGSITASIGSRLRLIGIGARGVTRGFIKGVRRVKFTSVRFGVATGLGSPGSAGALFGHAFIFAESLRKLGSGFYMDANPNLANRNDARRFSRSRRSNVPGILGIDFIRKSQLSKPPLNGRLVGPGIRLSIVQSIVWMGFVRGLESDLTYQFYSIPGGETVSCYTWAIEAYAKAIIIKATIPL